MPRLEFRILPDQGLVEVLYSRHPTFPEWKRLMGEVFADERFQKGFDFLFDKRGLVEAASNYYAEAVAGFYQEHRDKMGRCAIVVSGVLAFGMSRMTESFCMDRQVRAFMDINEAREWLRGNALSDAGVLSRP